MSFRVIGAGLGRTGTSSLREALQILLGRPCYHMMELIQRPEHTPFWHEAAFNRPVDWQTFLAPYGAAVDWPAAAFWPEISQAFPEAVIVLSLRSAESWWESAHRTIYAPRPHTPGLLAEMTQQISVSRFPIHPVIHDKEKSVALFHDWVGRVRAAAPAGRLVEWQLGDGWEPLCQALNLPVPAAPFPHRNTRAEFIDRHLK